MNPWQKETLNLEVGDFIIWQDEAVEMEGQPAVVTPGMKGKVLSLDGFHLCKGSNLVIYTLNLFLTPCPLPIVA